MEVFKLLEANLFYEKVGTPEQIEDLKKQALWHRENEPNMMAFSNNGCWRSEFKYKNPKRKPFHNLQAVDEADELQQVDKVLTANIEKIRKEINDLILQEYYLNQFCNFLLFTDNASIKKAYADYLDNNADDNADTAQNPKLTFIQGYIQIAIEEENLIYADPARKKQRAAATHHAFNKAVQELVSDYSVSDLPADNQEDTGFELQM